MKRKPATYYIANCFLLMLPVMIWDILLSPKLPTYFQPVIFNNNIPQLLLWSENTLRIALFAITLFMPVSFATHVQKKGIVLYVAGLLLYFSSWLVLIYFPFSAWSTGVWGFLAPAYTPFFWLMGIALVSDRLYFGIPYKRVYFITICILFLLCHNIHTFIVFRDVRNSHTAHSQSKTHLLQTPKEGSFLEFGTMFY